MRPFLLYEPLPFLFGIVRTLYFSRRTSRASGFLELLFGFVLNPSAITVSPVMTWKMQECSIFIPRWARLIPMSVTSYELFRCSEHCQLSPKSEEYHAQWWPQTEQDLLTCRVWLFESPNKSSDSCTERFILRKYSSSCLFCLLVFFVMCYPHISHVVWIWMLGGETWRD